MRHQLNFNTPPALPSPPPLPEKVKALKPALKKKKVSKKKPQKVVFKAAQDQGQELGSSEQEKVSKQPDQEESPQKEERKEVRRALESEPDTIYYSIGDTDLEQLFNSSSNKAKGARCAKKSKLSVEEQTLLWAEKKQKLRILGRKNKK